LCTLLITLITNISALIVEIHVLHLVLYFEFKYSRIFLFCSCSAWQNSGMSVRRKKWRAYE